MSDVPIEWEYHGVKGYRFRGVSGFIVSCVSWFHGFIVIY